MKCELCGQRAVILVDAIVLDRNFAPEADITQHVHACHDCLER